VEFSISFKPWNRNSPYFLSCWQREMRIFR
jgi:hypothetical protein